MKLGKYFWFFTKPSFFVHLFILVVLSSLFLATDYVKSYRTYGAMPKVLGEHVIVDLQAQVEPKSSPQPTSTAVAKPKPSSKLESSPVVASEKVSGAVNVDSPNPLCKGVKEDWKMIPEPGKEGLYIICNTTKENMASVSDLNSEQNTYRVAHGKNALNINSSICSIASKRAEEVAKNFSHDGFESAVNNSGLGFHSYGENIASGPLSAVHFIEWSWDRSPGHRENMLGDWSDGCAGVSGKYAVFLFAK